ncbi:hypothetical protein [Bradyrhizobium sp. CCGE-LA001]|uniref:hypothetical protein n=1 Tax=Bradyrhizobium sp. CCGE-LA001 TaxID=1223566 RepID=UPI000302C02B|nr:hypothetical protein [Bradyrhizobium sp. CCGE-LA001]
MLFPPGHRYMGRAIVPFGFGAVFTNITRKQFDQTNLKEVFSEHLCLFKDEMTEGADPEEFRSRLWRMVHPRFGEPLSMPQFDRLRALLFPEIRIRQIALPLDDATGDPSDRTLAVMDMHQEQFARSLGEGHRIFSRRRRIGQDPDPGLSRRISGTCGGKAGAHRVLRQRHRRAARGCHAEQGR